MKHPAEQKQNVRNEEFTIADIPLEAVSPHL
jgi:hypothetical protein